MTDSETLRDPLPETALKAGRKMVGPYLRRKYDIHVFDADRVPKTGPVLVLSNHIGWLDGPLLVALTPRPVHSLVKSESYVGKTAKLLDTVGQVPVLRTGIDANAMRTMKSALAHGQAVLVYPEGTRNQGLFKRIYPGAAYLAVSSGAPIVPVALFGTRIGDEDREAKPEKGRRIEIHYGEPFSLKKIDSPISKLELTLAQEELRLKLAMHVQTAQAQAQIELPERVA